MTQRIRPVAPLLLLLSFACARASVTDGQQPTVEVEPPHAQVATGGTVTFSAAVPGAASVTVTWKVEEGSAGGAVTASGLYTAPGSPGQFHVTATSTAAPTVSGSATVTVTAPTVAVAIFPVSASVTAGGTVSFTATVTGTGNTTVRWSVQEGTAGGAVSSSGVYTAPATAGTYHVVATSQADATRSAIAAVTVSSGGGGGTTTEQLVALKAHGIYFGHQSVGQFIMLGVDDLLAAVPAADRLGRGGLAQAGMGTWADDAVESNGAPLEKLANFRSQMAGLCGRVDIAFMKFCFADWSYIGANGPQALFNAYQATLSAVQAACPSVTLVHFTMPITNSDNEIIESYNALLRAGYGPSVFDLAREESTRPGGQRCLDGAGVPILCAEYTVDGAHPDSTEGRQRVAARLIAFLAAL